MTELYDTERIRHVYTHAPLMSYNIYILCDASKVESQAFHRIASDYRWRKAGKSWLVLGIV